MITQIIENHKNYRLGTNSNPLHAAHGKAVRHPNHYTLWCMSVTDCIYMQSVTDIVSKYGGTSDILKRSVVK